MGWFEQWRKQRAERRATASQRLSLAARYTHFREFLARNQEVLGNIARLQEKLSEGHPIEVAGVRSTCEQLTSDVQGLVEALVAMSDGRHTELRRAATSVAERVARKLELPPVEPGPLVISLDAVPDDVNQVGGKALRLGRLTRAGLPVPRGFAVSAYAQRLFLERSGLSEIIAAELTKTSADDLEGLRSAGEAIRSRILAAEAPPELREALAGHAANFGPSAAVRSSALFEDGSLSFAGQFESFLNVPRAGIASAYKRVLASQYSPRALYYCRAHGFSHAEMRMGVLVMEMVEARAAGVLYGADPSGHGAGARLINAVWGLGTLAVGGGIAPDIVRVEATGSVTTEVGDKAQMAECVPGGGIAVRDTPPEQRRAACLSADQARELARLAGRVEEQFAGEPQDIEWILDTAGRFLLLQSRPLNVRGRAGWQLPEVQGAQVLIEQAVVASRGVASGRVHVVSAEGKEAPLGSVLVARSPSLEFTLQLDLIRAMVCEVGAATSHLATVLREASLPALFGARGACERLKPGEIVTVDAFNGRVYQGRVEELLSAPRPDANLRRESLPHRLLKDVLEDVAPLNLSDPRSTDFRPGRCQTLHDIVRYAHEMAMRAMFEVPEGSPEAKSAKRLESDLPLDIWIIDLSRGLRPEVAPRPAVTIDEVQSRPFRAYWRGVVASGWKGSMPVSVGGFMSVVMTAATDPSYRERMEQRDFALLSDCYMNFTNRLGFHFAVIDSFLGQSDDSYIALTFYGGGADLRRRVRRVEFLSLVLRHLDFRLERQNDFLAARIDGYDAASLEERLDILGRLLMAARQLDMLMYSDAAARQYAQDFITGGYRLSL